MSAVTGKNAIANVLGNLAGPMVGLVMTPFYLRVIGLEGLGLVGLMAIITTTLQVFVSGASKSYQRDVSLVHSSAPGKLKGLVGGALIGFAILGLFLGLLVWLGGRGQLESLAAKTHFAPEILARTLVFLGALLMLGIFNGAMTATLIALRDQVWLTVFSVAIMVGTAVANWLALSQAPRVDVFYLCNLSGAAALCVCLAVRTRVLLRHSGAADHSESIRTAWGDRLKESGRLSAILIIHEGLGTLISQIDRILVTSRLPIVALGVYNLGGAPARMTSIFTNAVNSATFPEFCRLTNHRGGAKTIGEYIGRVTFLMVVLFGAGMIVLIPAAGDLLNLWLGAENVPASAASCLILLAAGNLLLAIAGPAYNLTVAIGRVDYGIFKNLGSLLILPPLGMFFIKIWGLAGVALVPVCYACICVGVCSAMVYSRHADIRGAWRWIAASCAALAVAGALGWGLASTGLSGLGMIAAALASAVVFVLGNLIGHFGIVPRRWLLALETGLAEPAGAPLLAPQQLPI